MGFIKYSQIRRINNNPIDFSFVASLLSLLIIPSEYEYCNFVTLQQELPYTTRMNDMLSGQ